MSWDQLKAYLENPKVALENLKRMGEQTEGDEVEQARKMLEFGGETPTNDQILAQIEQNRRTLENATGFVGGGIAAAESVPAKSAFGKLKDSLRGKTTRESLNKPAAEIPAEFGSRADIIRRANEVANQSTDAAVTAARENMLKRAEQVRSLSPEDATRITDMPGEFTSALRDAPSRSEDYQAAIRSLREGLDNAYANPDLPPPTSTSRLKPYSAGAKDELAQGKLGKEFQSQALVSQGGTTPPKIFKESSKVSDPTADRKMAQRLMEDARRARPLNMQESDLISANRALLDSEKMKMLRESSLEDLANNPEELARLIKDSPLKDLGTGKLPKLRQTLKGKK